MGWRKTCGTCMRPLPEATPYRTAAERDKAESPCLKAPPVVLEEEFREAKEDSPFWGMSVGFSWVVTGVLVGAAVHTDSRGLGVVGAFGLLLSLACAAGYIRGCATIKAWRDQMRAKFGGLK